MADALIVVSHPDPSSLNHALAEALHAGFREAGLSSHLCDLHGINFDPVITTAEARGRPSSDPLVAEQILLLRSVSILAVVHPNCWGAPPAMMKGWMDRVFAPGAAYAFPKGEDAGDAPMGLLKTKAAIVLNTSNTAEEREVSAFGDPLERIWRDCLLGYCGISDIERRVFRVVATSSQSERAVWLREAKVLAMKLASTVQQS